MDRREFFTPGHQKQLYSPSSDASKSSGALSGIQPYSGPWTSTEVLHLLRRTMFGAKKSDVDFFSGMNMSQAVDYLLTVPSAQPEPPLKTYANSTTARRS